MKKPGWINIVGIMGIILGCFGLFGAGSTIMTPKMMEMQKEMMPQMREMMEKQEGSSEATMAMMEKMWDVPEWFGTWCLISGVIALLIAGYYIFACVNLLRVKQTAVRMFYTAAGVSIAFAVIKGFVAVTAMSAMGMSVAFGAGFGIVINIILLVIVANGNKEIFTGTG